VGRGALLAGVLDGDAQQGCLWVTSRVNGVAARSRFTLPPSHRIAFNPARVIGPDGDVVATAGDYVELTGGATTDEPARCDTERLFEADAVRRVDGP
jgi:hypothetical protein